MQKRISIRRECAREINQIFEMRHTNLELIQNEKIKEIVLKNVEVGHLSKICDI
jgi:DNA-binding Xre family transcriptional regulator